MITLLERLLIKNRENVDDSKVRDAYGVLCCIVGIVLNLLLFAMKLVAGLISGALSIMADAFNNLSDAGSTIITLLGFKLAAKERDPDHPFGHGRMEYISGLLVSMVIVLMGFELAKSSIEKIIHPEPIDFSWISVAILIASILVKVYMAIYNRNIGKKINSASMKATSVDSLSDCISTSAVLICMLIAKFTSLELDAYCGLVVSVVILIAGIKAAVETISPLLGEAPAPDFVEKVEKMVMEDEIVTGIHDLVVHDYGPGRRMISLHAEVPCTLDIRLIHDHIDNLEEKLDQILGCTAVIHMDPIDVANEEAQKLSSMLKAALLELHPDLKMHDLRIVSGETHTNVIFDVVLPLDKKVTETQVLELVSKKLKELGNYFPVIKFDIPYASK